MVLPITTMGFLEAETRKGPRLLVPYELRASVVVRTFKEQVQTNVQKRFLGEHAGLFVGAGRARFGYFIQRRQ